ncbi:BRCT domain-containing protein [Rhodotorula paludigena]|uniref:BRCT domain-containing protein n=1 Tax=Rhodotorula paludigena TaxID=86838 RepID=UPI00317474A2
MASSSQSRVGGPSHAPLPRVTRSSSRRSLANIAEEADAAALAGTTSSSNLARGPPPGISGLTRSRTASELSTASSSRTRSSATSRPAARQSLSVSTGGKASAVPASARSRRVLGDSNVPTSAGSSNSAAGTTRPVKPIARRYSAAEASRMTGMGVVRAGPAVQGQRSPRKSLSSTSLAASGSAAPRARRSSGIGASSMTAGGGASNDPFSTAFVRPTFDFEVSREREVRPPPASTAMRRTGEGFPGGLVTLAEEPVQAALSPFDLTSPKKQRSVPATAPPTASSRGPEIFADDAAMDVDDEAASRSTSNQLLPIPPSSPVRGALSPRSLMGRPVLTRKRDALESGSESEEDDIDFLSPRKKSAKRIHLSAPSPVAAPPPARPFTGPVDEDATPRAPSIMPRSPPPKRRLVQPPMQAGSAAPVARSMPTSVPMQRGGRSFPLPNLTAMPPPPPSTATASRTFTGARPLQLASSATASTSTAPSASSRLPRPARVPLVADAPTVAAAHPPSRSTAPPPAADDSMAVDESASFAGADVSSLSTASASTTTSTRSEETARRLANLQSMLSRLQMPKPSGSGTASRRASAESATSLQADCEAPLAAEPQRRTRASLGSVPTASAAATTSHVAPLLPAGPTARRRSSIVASRPRGGIVNTATETPLGDVSMSSSTSAMSHSHRRSSSISSTTLPSAASSSFSLDAAAEKAAGVLGAEATAMARSKGKAALQGVVAFVDVRTAEGDDSGMIFVDMLKGLGARVTLRPSSLTTHIVFKSGRPSTLSFHRTAAPLTRPHLVGIAWVVRCAELGARADEAPFRVEDATAPLPGTGKENAGSSVGGKVDIAAKTAQAALGLGGAPGGKGESHGAGGSKRRKSMEPKALAALGSSVNGGDASFGTGSSGATFAARDAALKASIAASIERARRKSLQFAPKVGSPLAKRVFVMPDLPPAEEDD